MFRILTLNNISRNGLSRLPAGLYSVANEMTDPDALLVRSADLHSVVIPASTKAIARAGAGVNNIPVAELSKRGVPVFNAPGANANAVKELVIAGMLIAVRHLDAALRFVADLAPNEELEHRVETEKKRFVGAELAGKTLGVVGLGAIGVKVANAARALGMQVIGFDPHMTVDGAWQLSSDVVKASSLHELYAACDFVSLHVPLNEATRGIFGISALEHVRKGLVLLNFAREGVVDATALRRGLDDGRIGRYITDFPEVDLLTRPAVIALPHLGASTLEAEENCAVMVVEQLRDFLEHGNIQNAVNFPNTRMARAGVARICVANQNRPNMIGQLSQVLGSAGLNISQMHNASKNDLAYSLLDVDSTVPESARQAISVIDGILAVRVI